MNRQDRAAKLQSPPAVRSPQPAHPNVPAGVAYPLSRRTFIAVAAGVVEAALRTGATVHVLARRVD